MHHVNWIESNGIWLRYAEDGAGDRTVVLVHEMGGSLDSWDEVVPFLSDRYRVLRYDMRGFGMSEKIFGEFTLDDAISDLTGFLDALNVSGPVALVGCAVGAGVTLRVAAQRPDQVKALIAMAPATEIPAERVERAQQFPAKLAEKGMRRMVYEDIAPANYPKELQTDPVRYQRFIAQQSSVDPDSFSATFMMLLGGSYQPYFKLISCPTLIVAGEHDKGRSPEIVEPVAKGIPGAKFKVVPAGHFMAVQTPEIVGQMISDFLTEAGF